MSALIPPIYQALLGLGMVTALLAALAGLFWPTVEGWLFQWLQAWRRTREGRFQPKPRVAARWPR